MYSSPNKVSIGSVILTRQEVPDYISLGGRQQLVVHRLPGGGRIIDCLGPDDLTLAWSGTLIGQHADTKARDLDRMRRGGVAQRLTFESYTYDVVVTSFEYAYAQQGAVINYRIACLPLASANVTGLIVQANEVALSLSNQICLGFISQGITAGSNTMASGQALGAISRASLALDVSSASLTSERLSVAQSALKSGILASGEAVTSSSTGFSSPTGFRSTLIAEATQASGLLASAAQAQAYVGQSMLLIEA